MTTTYIDTGWTGTPKALAAALADPDLAPRIVATAGYQVLDGLAYVLVRALQALPPPAGVTLAGPDLTRAVAGVFMADTSTPAPNLSTIDTTFFGTNTFQTSIGA